ncbi:MULTISPECIES: IclR family transcriptional regulator [Peribacillus]|jgi:IclR family transcriptional regulator, KDG regulon repressor|uniref:IclR family transcriptional regulator n=1 Tax=Peribacillus TaxID=2675229 RepID=UPI001912CB47|nr:MULTISPECIES: IclR family transcriptional regulator [unclassified Peribacillus]MBK5444845.1 IclR family transcriptional regulator [Peribacillus sp. TH24]MBK5498607.1 IclR family transcriptional regulator [Peribacillus sp. TH14]WMX56281.1 IclR family transcriptional regulator [Peribacillus sp. R9-11]
MDENESSKGSRTVQRSINIMNCFTMEESELTLTEISNKINLAKSTTSRLIDTLVHNGLLQKKFSNSKYQFGYKMYQFGRIAENTISFDITEIAKPFMKKLRNEIGESVSLYMLENKKRRCIARYGSNQSIRHVVSIGEILSLEIGSGGKVLLAFQSPSFIESTLNDLDSESLRISLTNELPIIQKESISISLDERGAGVNSVASPIFGLDREVNFCLCVSGPSTRFTEESMNAIKNEVKTIALKISECFSNPKENHSF